MTLSARLRLIVDPSHRSMWSRHLAEDRHTRRGTKYRCPPPLSPIQWDAMRQTLTSPTYYSVQTPPGTAADRRRFAATPNCSRFLHPSLQTATPPLNFTKMTSPRLASRSGTADCDRKAKHQDPFWAFWGQASQSLSRVHAEGYLRGLWNPSHTNKSQAANTSHWREPESKRKRF